MSLSVKEIIGDLRRRDRSDSRSSGGLNFLEALFLVLMTLKLCGVLDWSWFWITAPLWGGFLFGLIVIAAVWCVLQVRESKVREWMEIEKSRFRKRGDV